MIGSSVLESTTCTSQLWCHQLQEICTWLSSGYTRNIWSIRTAASTPMLSRQPSSGSWMNTTAVKMIGDWGFNKQWNQRQYWISRPVWPDLKSFQVSWSVSWIDLVPQQKTTWRLHSSLHSPRSELSPLWLQRSKQWETTSSSCWVSQRLEESIDQGCLGIKM